MGNSPDSTDPHSQPPDLALYYPRWDVAWCVHTDDIEISLNGLDGAGSILTGRQGALSTHATSKVIGALRA